jgi:outer membrane protein
MAPRRSLSSRMATVAAVTGALVAPLPGCATWAVSHAPAGPDRPWTIPPNSEYTAALRDATAGAPHDAGPDVPPPKANPDAAPQNRVSLDSGRNYELAALIDLAERHHPETREAWEQARQAALAIGLAEHTYLPQITATVLAGYQHTPVPIPKNLVPAGYFTADTYEILPMLAVNWLLFDFGQREGQVAAARAKSFVANVAFTGAHEKVIYAVSRAYFALGAARARVRVAETAFKNASLAQDIGESRQARGVATVVEVSQARRQTAQAHFNVVRATGAEHAAYNALVASMGIEPSVPVGVADTSDRPLPAAPMQDVRILVEGAVAQRPDVIAALGKVRAAEATLRSARAAYLPKIAVTGEIYQNVGGLSTMGSPFYTVDNPGWNVLLGIELPLFDGGARAAHIAIAGSEVSAARADLDGARDRAVQEVTDAYDQLQTSVAEQEAAAVVAETASTALDAALDAYRNGMGPLSDVITSENGLSDAQLERETARANVFTAAASLAFATGSLVSER